MAITKTNRANFSTTTDATSFTTASFTPGASAILIVSVQNTKGTTPNAPTLSDTGNGYTWHQVHTVLDTDSIKRLTQYWTLTGASPASMTLTADFAGVTQTGCFIHCVEFAGLNTSAPVGNVDTRNPAPSGTAQALTLSFGNSANGVYFVIGTNGSATDVPVVSNGQQISIPNIDTPSAWMSVGWDSVNQTAPGFTWTPSRTRWGAGFELVAAAGGAKGPLVNQGIVRRLVNGGLVG